ncbi:MAG: hypothetical protein WC900_01620 [Oscillospiraceae bacterium]|jgi:hypothetical protein
MSRFSKREKTLLYILFMTAVILSLWFFMIKPVCVSALSFEARKTALELQKQSMEAEASKLLSRQENYTLLSSEISSLLDDFYTSNFSGDIDLAVTAQIIKNRLKIESLSISESKSDQLSSIKVIAVNASATGSSGDIFSLIEDIRTNKKMVLTSFNIGASGEMASVNISLEISLPEMVSSNENDE